MGFNKKVLSKAVSELDKAKAPAKPRDIITDPAGQWKYPGQKTRIPGSSITMQGVNYPVWAQPNVGPGSMMQPGQDYDFPNADYVDETPMVKKGGTLKSKRYSSNISATNKLFTKNKLFQNKKSKIFDPNAKFKSGGSKLGPINLNPNPLSHYELNYGYNLPTEQDGGAQDKYNSKLKDDVLISFDEHAKQFPSLLNDTYDYDTKGFYNEVYDKHNGDFDKITEALTPGSPTAHVGTDRYKKPNHPTFSKESIYHIPIIRPAGKWGHDEEGDYFKASRKNIKNMNESDGSSYQYFQRAEDYDQDGKPDVRLKYRGKTLFEDGGENEDEYMDLTDEEIQAYKEAGYVVEEEPEYEIGGYVQHELVKAQKGLTKKPLEISDPKEFAYRNKMYADSLTLYNQSLNDKKWLNSQTPIKKYPDGEHLYPGTEWNKYTGKDNKKFNYAWDRLKKANKKAPTGKLTHLSISNILNGKDDPTPMNSSHTYFTNYKKPVQPVTVKKGNNDYIKPSTQFEKQKTDDRIITDTDVVPEGYRRMGDLYTASIDEKTGKVTEKRKFMHELIPQLAPRSLQQSTPPEQTIIPGKPYVKPKPNVGPRYGSLAGDENLELPSNYTQAEREAARRQRGAEEFQRKNLEYQEQQRGTNKPVAQVRKDGGIITEAWEDELDEHTIALLKKAGYIVEELD